MRGADFARLLIRATKRMRVAPLNDLIFNRITIQSDRSMAAGGLLRPGTVCRSSCYTFLRRLRPIRSSAIRFAADSPLKGPPAMRLGAPAPACRDVRANAGARSDGSVRADR